MKRVLFIILICLWATNLSALTYPDDLDVSFERTFPGTAFSVGEIVEIKVQFVTQETTQLNSFFYSEQLPNWIRLFPDDVKLNNESINYQFEEGEEDEILMGLTPYRWILDDPHGQPDLIINHGDRLEFSYRLVANQSGFCTPDHNGWFGFMGETNGIAILGDDDTSITLFFGTLTGLPEDVPTTALAPAWPNPFNPSTRLSFANEREQRLVLAVHDVTGRRVRLLRDEIIAPGRHEVTWNGCDDADRVLPSGVYFVNLMGDDGPIDRQQIVLLK
ncbi:MAG: hypothetical protein GY835_02390 [bacterium]|nr:hypothetical protein [bacterium]